MKNILIILFMIFSLYLYINVDQHSKDQIKSITLSIPAKVISLIHQGETIIVNSEVIK
jgi:transcriptional regulator of met regulon